jgi:hypothetical protein
MLPSVRNIHHFKDWILSLKIVEAMPISKKFCIMVAEDESRFRSKRMKTIYGSPDMALKLEKHKDQDPS